MMRYYQFFFKIKEIQGKILFQTFQQIYIYDPAPEVIEIVNALSGFNELFSFRSAVLKAAF